MDVLLLLVTDLADYCGQVVLLPQVLLQVLLKNAYLQQHAYFHVLKEARESHLIARTPQQFFQLIQLLTLISLCFHSLKQHFLQGCFSLKCVHNHF